MGSWSKIVAPLAAQVFLENVLLLLLARLISVSTCLALDIQNFFLSREKMYLITRFTVDRLQKATNID